MSFGAISLLRLESALTRLERRAGRSRPAGDPLALDVLSAALGELSRSGGTHRRPLETVFDKFQPVDERTVKPGIATDAWDPVRRNGLARRLLIL